MLCIVFQNPEIYFCQTGLEGESKDRGFWCSLKSKSVDVTYKMIELQHEVNEVKDGELYTQALR